MEHGASQLCLPTRGLRYKLRVSGSDVIGQVRREALEVILNFRRILNWLHLRNSGIPFSGHSLAQFLENFTCWSLRKGHSPRCQEVRRISLGEDGLFQFLSSTF